ncbi:MAG TPA: PIN domain-containing protein [archaeon]|nr:PIN domain-containing protein [archaeon]
MTDNERIFLDTNILVYAYQKEAGEKHNVCKKLLEECFRAERDFYVSNQVLAELSSVLLKKIEKPLPKNDVKQIIEEINSIPNMKKIDYRCKTVQRALSGSGPFWDMLISETMKGKNVLKIYTENTKDFAQMEGIVAINPIDKKTR